MLRLWWRLTHSACVRLTGRFIVVIYGRIEDDRCCYFIIFIACYNAVTPRNSDGLLEDLSLYLDDEFLSAPLLGVLRLFAATLFFVSFEDDIFLFSL